jgi:hypothetical protein
VNDSRGLFFGWSPLAKALVCAVAYFVFQVLVSNARNVIFGSSDLLEKLIHIGIPLSTTILLVLFLPYYFSRKQAPRAVLVAGMILSLVCVIPAFLKYFPVLYVLIFGIPLSYFSTLFYNFFLRLLFDYNIFNPSWDTNRNPNSSRSQS